MAVTAKVFGQFLMCCMRKEVDVLNDEIKIMLLNSNYNNNIYKIVLFIK